MKIKWKKIIQFKWFKRLYVLYIFGFVCHFRPTLPFGYEFLIKDKGFSEDAAQEDLFPVFFYSTTIALLPVFLFMEFIKFTPVIIISTLTGIVATCLNVWTESLLDLQIAQAFYGCMTAAELAYYVSVYRHGDIKSYQRLTSYVRAGPLIGKLLGTLFSQLFVYAVGLTYTELHYFNLSAFIIATVLTIFLPPGDETQDEKPEKTDNDQSKISSIYTNLTRLFPNKYAVKWTIWSILTICGYNQLSVYTQPLFHYVQKTEEVFVYNGYQDGLFYTFALTGTILGGFANFDWKYKGDLILSMASLVEGFMLLFMSQITNYVLHCMFYCILGFMFHFTITVLTGEIAKLLTKGSFGLLFGFIALAAWTLSSIMVSLLNRLSGKDRIQDLFMIYGFYHLGIAILFILTGLAYWFAKHTYH